MRFEVDGFLRSVDRESDRKTRSFIRRMASFQTEAGEVRVVVTEEQAQKLIESAVGPRRGQVKIVVEVPE